MEGPAIARIILKTRWAQLAASLLVVMKRTWVAHETGNSRCHWGWSVDPIALSRKAVQDQTRGWFNTDHQRQTEHPLHPLAGVLKARMKAVGRRSSRRHVTTWSCGTCPTDPETSRSWGLR
jgi:hypothetical protein